MNAALPADSRMRLDELLVLRGEFATRSRARDAIERGAVRVDGAVGRQARPERFQHAAIEVDDPAQRYVSRAALKLIAGLDHFRFDPSGCCALDIGASTGGFTQVLLERGAAHVTAIDVGHGQFDAGAGRRSARQPDRRLERPRPRRPGTCKGSRRISSSAMSASFR